MAAFGENNFATPFGALSPSGFFDSAGAGFYDYSGFSSRGAHGFSTYLGFSGFSGASGFSSFCGADGIEFIPFRPTLTFPLNYEVLRGRTTVLWKEASPVDPCDPTVTYELQFTRAFSRDIGWRTIGDDLPAGTTSFVFDVSSIPFTLDGGLRIRAKDPKNLFSDWSTTISPFEIANHPPFPVTLLSPVGSETFDNQIPVAWREANPKDLDGDQVTYQIQVTAQFSADTGWVTPPGAGALTEGTVTFSINSFDFPAGPDFGLRIAAVDSHGALSPYKMAGPFKVAHNGNFVIDTIPPSGSMVINDGSTLATDHRAKLDLFAVDLTTGVKDVRFRNSDEDCWGDWDTFVPQKFWDMSPGDGVKRILVQFRDFANNVSSVCDCEIVSRVLCDEGNATSLQVYNDKLYVGFDKNGNLIEYKALVRQAASLTQPEITALATLSNFLYIAAYDPVALGTAVYKFDGTEKLVVTVGSAKVLSMVGYNNAIYMGLDDGRILALSGTSTSTSFSGTAPILRLRTDGAVLFATEGNKGEYLSFDGATWAIHDL